MKKITLAVSVLLLVGCSASKPSPERHTYAFVSHRSAELNGNFTSSNSQNFRLNIAQFRQMYQTGQKDKAKGMSQKDANAYAQYIREEILKNSKSHQTFAGNASDKWTETPEKRDAELFGNELSATYLDGYNGVR